ncbi:MAG: hypothetical protein ACK46Q_13825, partial [Hyphomonas sp.]
MDQLFGSLRSLRTPGVLAASDVLTFRRAGRMSGRLSLYHRGGGEHLYAEAPDWEGSLSSDAAYSFEETCGWWDGQPGSAAERVAR